MSKGRTSEKPLRADARRNREALLSVARAAFAEGDLGIRLEEIARRAGVGVGTLYRHFDTREAIIEAVYKQEIDAMCSTATELLTTLSPEDALHRFLEHLVSHLAANIGLARALGSMLGAGGAPRTEGDQEMNTALTMLMEKASASGAIRSDIEPATIEMTLSALCIDPGQHQWKQRAMEVVSLIMDGLRLLPSREGE